ncbi:MAG: DUF4199 domain-containing protein [Capnocytophaga sp.]|nr:DUF4199 domain-containing protein [Capnocytophaga sp.]
MINSKKIMLIFGLVSGGLSIILHYIQYYFNFQVSVIERIIFVILPIFVTIFCIFLGIYYSKKREFSQMLKIGLGISLIGAIAMATYYVLFLKYGASPEYFQDSMETQLTQIKTQQPEISEAELYQIKTQIEESQSILTQFNMTLIKNIFFGFFISLGSSAILKIIQKNKL